MSYRHLEDVKARQDLAEGKRPPRPYVRMLTELIVLAAIVIGLLWWLVNWS